MPPKCWPRCEEAPIDRAGSRHNIRAFVVEKSGMIQHSQQTAKPEDLANFEAVKAALIKWEAAN